MDRPRCAAVTDLSPHTPLPRSLGEKPLLRALRGARVVPPPIWLMRQAGRYLPEYRALREEAGHFLALCYDPERAAEVTLQPVRRFGLDAAILFADILLLPHAIGQDLAFREGEGPVLTPLTETRDLARLRPERLHEGLAPVYETVRRVARAVPKEVALIGFAGAPWTVASYMVAGGGSSDQGPARHWAYRDPEGFGRLIDLLTEATGAYLAAQIEAGVEAVQIFDSWAGGLPEPAFRRWCVEPARRIVLALKARFPEVPVIGFPRGCGPLHAAYMCETGIDAIAIDTGLPVEWARAHLQPLVTVQGNLDPWALVAGGTALQAETERLLSSLGQGSYVFNVGHGIVPQTPPEHVAALVRQVKAWQG